MFGGSTGVHNHTCNWGSSTVKDLKWELRRKSLLDREVHATRNW